MEEKEAVGLEVGELLAIGVAGEVLAVGLCNFFLEHAGEERREARVVGGHVVGNRFPDRLDDLLNEVAHDVERRGGFRRDVLVLQQGEGL